MDREWNGCVKGCADGVRHFVSVSMMKIGGWREGRGGASMQSKLEQCTQTEVATSSQCM